MAYYPEQILSDYFNHCENPNTVMEKLIDALTDDIEFTWGTRKYAGKEKFFKNSRGFRQLYHPKKVSMHCQ